jgi:ribonuclease J
VGVVFHTGDFKLDVSPIDGKIMDLGRIAEIGKNGVTLLLCESTNAERAGFTASERTVGSSLERIFAKYEDRRLIITTFSSNVHRVQQIINTSYNHGRKVAILGRSMVNVIGAAAELGYIDLPDGVLVDVRDIGRYRPEDITLITTGSQGEPMSALYRIAFSEHDRVKISPKDVVVLSSSAIPGNEKLVGKIINALVKNGVKVVNDSTEDVHVSGHACREEIKLMMALLRPKYLMPIHGEYRHLYANKDIGEFMGIPSENIFISEIGKVLEIDRKGARFNGSEPAGQVLVDGSGVGDIGSVVLRDRKHLSEDGLVVVVATIDMDDKMIISGPDIVSRGFVYVKESEELMREAKTIAEASLMRAITKGYGDWAHIKGLIRDDLAKFIYKETKRKPMILPVIMDV